MSTDLSYEECTLRAASAASKRLEEAQLEEERKCLAGTLDESTDDASYLRELVNELASRRMPDRRHRKRDSVTVDRPLNVKVFPKRAGAECIVLELEKGTVVTRDEANQYSADCGEVRAVFELVGKSGTKLLHMKSCTKRVPSGARGLKRPRMFVADRTY